MVAVVVGQVIGQMSVVLVVPLLTRSYDPVVLGAFQIALALATTLQPLSSLRTEFVIPSLQHDATAYRLRARAAQMSAALLLVLALTAVVLALTGQNTAAGVAAMTGVVVVGLAWTVVDNAGLVRRGAQKELALRNMLAGVLTAVLQLVAALLQADVFFLALSMLIGRALAILATGASSSKLNRRDTGAEPRVYGARRMVAAIASGMTASASAQALTFGSGLAYGASASGFVGVSQRVAGAPIMLMGQGLSQALQGSTARAVRSGHRVLGARLRSQVLLLGGIAVLASAALIILAPALAEPVLGDGWGPAGVITAILAIPLSFQLVVGPLMPVLPMLGREGLLLSVQLVRFALVATALVCGYHLGVNLYGMTAAYGVATVVGYVVMLIVVFREVGKFDRK